MTVHWVWVLVAFIAGAHFGVFIMCVAAMAKNDGE